MRCLSCSMENCDRKQDCDCACHGKANRCRTCQKLIYIKYSRCDLCRNIENYLEKYLDEGGTNARKFVRRLLAKDLK